MLPSLHPAPLVALLIFLRFALPSSTAEVFTRVPRQPRTVLEQAGGRVLRTTRITVNGQSGHLTLIGFEQPVTQVAGILARLLERPGLPQAAAGGALWLEWPAANAHSILLAPGAPTASLALLVEAPPSPRGAPGHWPWPDLPPPANVTLAFSAELDEPRSTLLTGTSPLRPEQIRHAIGSHLAAHGWSPATPAANALPTALYVRGRDIVVLTVLPEHEAAGSRILLHRRTSR